MRHGTSPRPDRPRRTPTGRLEILPILKILPSAPGLRPIRTGQGGGTAAAPPVPAAGSRRVATAQRITAQPGVVLERGSPHALRPARDVSGPAPPGVRLRPGRVGVRLPGRAR